MRWDALDPEILCTYLARYSLRDPVELIKEIAEAIFLNQAIIPRDVQIEVLVNAHARKLDFKDPTLLEAIRNAEVKGMDLSDSELLATEITFTESVRRIQAIAQEIVTTLGTIPRATQNAVLRHARVRERNGNPDLMRTIEAGQVPGIRVPQDSCCTVS